MGLLETSWEATYQGQRITVARNEVTRGFVVECDGDRVAKQSWSLVGTGSIEGTLSLDGREVPIVVTLTPISKCTITIDGEDVPVERVG